jgi:DNA-binding NarL/FixJ family response regulator
MSGIPYYPNTLDSKAADKSGYNKGHEFDIEFIRMVSELSPAQNRVAELLAHDMLNPQIAQKLSISISAVENNINQIYEKLNISHKEEQPRSKFNHFFGEYFRQRSNGVK